MQHLLAYENYLESKSHVPAHTENTEQAEHPGIMDRFILAQIEVHFVPLVLEACQFSFFHSEWNQQGLRVKSKIFIELRRRVIRYNRLYKTVNSRSFNQFSSAAAKDSSHNSFFIITAGR